MAAMVTKATKGISKPWPFVLKQKQTSWKLSPCRKMTYLPKLYETSVASIPTPPYTFIPTVTGIYYSWATSNNSFSKVCQDKYHLADMPRLINIIHLTKPQSFAHRNDYCTILWFDNSLWREDYVVVCPRTRDRHVQILCKSESAPVDLGFEPPGLENLLNHSP